MGTRIVGVVTTSALACALVASTIGVASGAGAQRDEDTCFGEAPTRTATSSETVVGTEGPDVIIGGARVDGLGGDDYICDATYALGGAGNDRIRVLGSNTGKGQSGDDELVAIASLSDTAGARLVGGAGADVFWGSTLGETILGGPGADLIWAGGGNDYVVLGKDDDEGYGQTGDDRFQGGEGNDFVDGGPGRDSVVGGPGLNRCQGIERPMECKVVR